MIELENTHISLDEARSELFKRWNDIELKKKIELELGEYFMPQFSDRPRGVSFRQLCTPEHGFTFFYQCSKYIGSVPLILEYHDDIFTHLNEEKKGLGRLRVTLEDKTKATVDIMDFHANEKKKLGECILGDGEKLVDFHRKLFDVSEYEIDILENSKWFHNFGTPSNYYYYLLLHYVAHGVAFENMESDEDDEKGVAFINNITTPAIKKIEEKFGVKPLIVRLYPRNQDAEEDFYWWNYPSNVNKYIIEYAKKQNIPFKKYEI
jgi:hypothetical protein